MGTLNNREDIVPLSPRFRGHCIQEDQYKSFIAVRFMNKISTCTRVTVIIILLLDQLKRIEIRKISRSGSVSCFFLHHLISLPRLFCHSFHSVHAIALVIIIIMMKEGITFISKPSPSHSFSKETSPEGSNRQLTLLPTQNWSI